MAEERPSGLNDVLSARNFAISADDVTLEQFQRFRDLIGSEGIIAVLSRALYLARSEAPFLRRVDVVGSQTSIRLAGLRESLEGVDEGGVRLSRARV